MRKSKAKILYVEDSPENAQLVHRVLEARGYEVIGAENGLLGLDLAKRERPDLILVDLCLPDMDGCAVATRIKKTAGLGEIPIVALTANAMKGERERALVAGCDGYIPKPIDIRTFPAQVEAFLKGQREAISPEEEMDYLKEHSVRLVESLEEQVRQLAHANEERQQHLERLRERTEELLLLLEITTTLSSSLHLQEMLQAAARITAQRLSVTFCRILLVNRNRTHLMLMAAYSQRELKWDQGMGHFCSVLDFHSYQRIEKTHEPLLLREGEIASSDLTDLERLLLTGGLAGLKSLLLCPIVRKGFVIGLLAFGEQRQWERSPFSPVKIHLFQAVAAQMGNAIENARLYEEVVFKGNQLKAANLDSIKALAEALETKDMETKGHSDRTVAYALAIARRLGLSEQEQEWIQYAAILHDIGKIGIPDQILKKPGRLTPEEYQVMMRHTEYGVQIVRQIKFLEPVVPMIGADHERWDGKGYPYGLKGEAIPLGGRIVAIVDAYDAMTSDRVYRKAPGEKFAIEELKRCAGTQFDPHLVEVFLEILKEENSS